MNHALFVFSTLVCLAQSNNGSYDTYENHPCIRPCNNNTTKMLCEYEWTLEWYSVLSKACLNCPFNTTDCFNRDCVSGNGVVRAVIAVNRMIPGPAINVCEFDEIKVVVNNMLHSSEGTTIHWHGIKQINTPYMDGVSMITQCPIIAHTNFEYRFIAYGHGTHLWHAHAGLQRADGVFGPIIVHQYEEENPYFNTYDYDLKEHVITVNDWINDTAIAKFSGHHHNDGDNKPSSILINGKGVLKTFNSSGQIVYTPRAVFSVEHGKAYRFRLINAGILYCPIEFSIDEHNLTVIASDGDFIEPFEVESLVIYAGERYDFILNADRDIQNYWIRAKGFADCSVFGAQQTAILNYKINNTVNNLEPGNSSLSYKTMSRKGLQLNPWNRIIDSNNSHLYKSIDQLKGIPDKYVTDFLEKINTTNVKKYYLAMEFNKISNPEFNDEHYYSLSMLNELNRQQLYTPQINNISMHMPSVPLLYRWNEIPKKTICNSGNKHKACLANEDYCSCVHTYEFEIGDVVEFVIVDEGFTFQSNHPMHLHGHQFAVLAIQKLNKSLRMSHVIEMDKQNLINRNLDRPPLKDTVTVPVGGYTIIRFIADNPGTWLLHCHLDFHSEVGMMVVIKVGSLNDLPNEPSGWPQCGSYTFKEAKLNLSNQTKSDQMFIFIFSITFIFGINSFKL